eukprot:8103781-Lingulodinium_polyedra.AAC.1
MSLPSATSFSTEHRARRYDSDKSVEAALKKNFLFSAWRGMSFKGAGVRSRFCKGMPDQAF